MKGKIGLEEHFAIIVFADPGPQVIGNAHVKMLIR